MNKIALDVPRPRWSLPLLESKVRYRGAKGGRASGKSHFMAEAIVLRMISDPNLRVVCIREVQKSLKFSAKQLLADKIASLGYGHLFEIQSTEIKSTVGNGIIIFQGMQDHTAESVKSLEGFDIAWCEEAQSLSRRSLELLDPTIRKEGSEIWFSWNPFKDTDPVEQIFKDNSDSVLVHVNWYDNPFCPEAMIKLARRMKETDLLRYNHVWKGDYLKEVDGALWTSDMINLNRVDPADIPELARIVVAIDPAVTGGKNADETGIVVAGRAANKQEYYVLEDATLRGSPDKWISKAISRYHHYEADRIVAEVNQGGDMVQKLILDSDRSVAYRAVRATRGKMLRAEPIAALYEREQVFHAGRFPELEEQMIFYNGSGNVSPDRLDALVWAITELSQSSGQAVWRIS